VFLRPLNLLEQSAQTGALCRMDGLNKGHAAFEVRSEVWVGFAVLTGRIHGGHNWYGPEAIDVGAHDIRLRAALPPAREEVTSSAYSKRRERSNESYPARPVVRRAQRRSCDGLSVLHVPLG